MDTLRATLAYAAMVAVILTPVLLAVLIRTIRSGQKKDAAIGSATDRAKAILDKPRLAICIATAATVLTALGMTWAGIGETDMPKHQKNQSRLTDAGYAKMAAHDYRSAKRLFTNGLGAGEDKVLCIGGLAECHLELKEYDRASARADELAHLSGGLVRAIRIRGRVLHALGDLEAAREQWRMGVMHNDPISGDLLAFTAGG